MDSTAAWALVGFTAVLAVAALVGLLGYLIQRQTQRFQFGPVLRVDVGPANAVGDWSPPEPEALIERDQSVTVEGASEEQLVVYAWVTNQRRDAGAGASSLWIEVRVTFRDGVADESFTRTARLIYLEPNRTARIALLRFPAGLGRVRVEVVEVLYRSLVGHESSEVHGRLCYEYRVTERGKDEVMVSAVMRRRWRTGLAQAAYNGAARRLRRFERHGAVADGQDQDSIHG